jgi:hypothetical protein
MLTLDRVVPLGRSFEEYRLMFALSDADLHLSMSVEELGRIRMQAVLAFLDDYDLGKSQGRYVDAELPSIAFPDKSFDLAVCSHFLFLYTEHLSEDFHRSAILELCRVACEVRIFPLLALDSRTSPYVARMVDDLSGSGSFA